MLQVADSLNVLFQTVIFFFLGLTQICNKTYGLVQSLSLDEPFININLSKKMIVDSTFKKHKTLRCNEAYVLS